MKSTMRVALLGVAAVGVAALGLTAAFLFALWQPSFSRSSGADGETRLPAEPLHQLFLMTRAPTYQVNLVEPTHAGLLGRELIRQSVLIAARDELGVHTRDETLGDPIVGSDPRAVDIKTTIQNNGAISMSLALSGVHQSNWTHREEWSVPKKETEPLDYVALCESLEKRSREQFPEALRSARFEGRGSKPWNEQPLPEVVEGQLARLSVMTQLSAVRRLHAHVRDNGPSKDAMAGLARGYANLAMLTYPLWTPRSPAFAARSLLYAQRLVAADPRSPWGPWHRAYALAMVGLDGAALADLEAAKALAGSNPLPAPTWVSLIEAQCRFDPARVREIIAQSNDASDLAQFLLFRSLGGEYWAYRPAAEVAREFLNKRHADCIPITHALAHSPSIDDMHRATTAAFESLESSFDDGVAGIWEAPSEIKAIATEEDPLSIVPSAMVGCRLDADPGAPSANVIGGIVQEISLLQLYDRLRFMHETWNVPWREEMLRYWPRVESHPLANLVHLAVMDPRRDPRKGKELFDRMRIPDARMTINGFAYKLQGIQQGSVDLGSELWRLSELHLDDTGRDYCAYALVLAGKDHARFLPRWVEVSPHRPVAHALLVRSDFDNKRKDLDDIMARFGKHPEASGILAEALLKNGLEDEAVNALKVVVEVEGGKSSYFQLADAYKRGGDLEGWRRTLDAFLKQPSEGLGHAEAQVAIAKHLMRQGKFEDALPYANAAAATFSSWGLVCSAYCLEGLKQWEPAEQIMVSMIERYPAHACEWYFWCRRTGHGDVARAKQLAEKFMAALEHPESAAFVHGQNGFVQVIDGNDEAALEEWEAAFDEDDSPFAGLMGALCARRCGRPREEIQWLERIGKESKPKAPDLRALATLAEKLRADRASQPSTLSEEIVEEIAKPVDEANRLNVYYFAAEHWDAKGEKERARKYFERVRDNFFEDKRVCTLAALRLQDFSKQARR